MSSSKAEEEMQGTYTVDLLMPIDAYWEIARMLHEANYLTASNEPHAEVTELLKRVFREAAPHAIHEMDRIWLHHRAIGKKPPI